MSKSTNVDRDNNQQRLAQYARIIREQFNRVYRENAEELPFSKADLEKTCQDLGEDVSNVPDIIYTFRVRRELPEEILARGNWVISPRGRGLYAFTKLANPPRFDIAYTDYAPVRIYSAIPEVVYGLLRRDEQSLLTKVLYNRIIDVFTGLTCFLIQNHYRSFVEGVGEVELDALYVGVDKAGRLSIIPVEAKSKAEHEKMGRVQIAHMAHLARQDFPELDRIILGIKDLPDDTIAVVQFTDSTNPDEIQIMSVKRFQIVWRKLENRPQI